MEDLDFCYKCGDLKDDKGECYTCSPKYKESRKDFKFEYAFESLTNRDSQFKRNWPNID